MILLYLVLAIESVSPRAEGVSRPLEGLDRNESFLRTTKHFLQQYQRVNSFECQKHLKSLGQSYRTQRRHFVEAENILDDEKRREITFFNLQPEERRRLAPIFPLSLEKFIGQLNRPEIAGPDLPLLLSLFMRETNFKIFLDEDTTSTVVNGPGARPGAGLAQITAWIEEYRKKWGPHGYEQYATERLRLELSLAHKEVPSDTLALIRQWLPLSIELESTKPNLSNMEAFVRSPYNPAVAFWYGKFSVADAEKKLDELGIREMNPVHRAAIIGAYYNAGEGRVRCAAERVRIWNEFFESLDIRFPEADYLLKQEEWPSLRKMLYLHSPALRDSGLPEALVLSLENACQGKSNCSCLDREPRPRSSTLEGADFKGAVSISYGDHMVKLYECFRDYADRNRWQLDPQTTHCFEQ